MLKYLTLLISTIGLFSCQKPQVQKPLNILILHADQWRAQAFGYAGNPNVMTPNFDAWEKTVQTSSMPFQVCLSVPPIEPLCLQGNDP